jgi:hypothetical protein
MRPLYFMEKTFAWRLAIRCLGLNLCTRQGANLDALAREIARNIHLRRRRDGPEASTFDRRGPTMGRKLASARRRFELQSCNSNKHLRHDTA